MNNDDGLKEKLMKADPYSNWKNVYHDGWSGGKEVSIHYFQNSLGDTFGLKVKDGWSNGRR